MSLHPYLFFTNTAREAMTCYQEILGGELDVMGVAEMPEGEADRLPFEASPDFVMHAALSLPDGGLLMASDDPTGDGRGTKGAAVSVVLDDADDARRVFDALATDGEVQMPLGETFWSPVFGTCVDRFGVNWMVNVDAPETD